jgi:hypothetical protein
MAGGIKVQPSVAAITLEELKIEATPTLPPLMAGGIQVQPSVAAITSGERDFHEPPTSVNEGVTSIRVTPPTDTLDSVVNNTVGREYLRSPRRHRVQFSVPEQQSVTTGKFYAKEVALDNLLAFEKGSRLFKERHDHSSVSPPWWADEGELNDQLWRVALGEVGALADKAQALNNTKDDMLPPPYGAGYVFAPGITPLSVEDQSACRVVFKVDSGCEPWSIVSRRLVQRAGLTPFKAKTHLRLPDCDTVIASEEMVRLTLKVTMNGRPHLFPFTCVVWERGALHHDMLISQTVAVTTGLSVFVHDNLLREVIMGRRALLQHAAFDPPELPEGTVASISGDQDPFDEELFQRISPLDSIRSALKPPEKTDDEWVNEELDGPLKKPCGKRLMASLSPRSCQPALLGSLTSYQRNSASSNRRTLWGKLTPIYR